VVVLENNNEHLTPLSAEEELTDTLTLDEWLPYWSMFVHCRRFSCPMLDRQRRYAFSQEPWGHWRRY